MDRESSSIAYSQRSTIYHPPPTIAPTIAPPRLILFPGLAADGRVYDSQRRAFPQLEVPPWLEPIPRESLPDYAHRLAATIVPDGRPIFLGGFSYGAAIALEVARHLPDVGGVSLIGGALTYRAISLPYRLLCHAARFVPSWAVRLGLPFFPFLLRLIEDLTPEQAALYGRMAREMPPEQIRWGAASLIGWTFDSQRAIPIRHIHGDLDTIIPLTKATRDFVIPGGRHLVSLKRADEVNAILAALMCQPG